MVKVLTLFFAGVSFGLLIMSSIPIWLMATFALVHVTLLYCACADAHESWKS